jgi:hypothetical protein
VRRTQLGYAAGAEPVGCSHGGPGPAAALSEEVRLLRAGIDVRQLDLFRELTPSVFIADAGNITISDFGPSDPMRADVRFCYDFAVETILDLQEQDTRVRGVVSRKTRLQGLIKPG